MKLTGAEILLSCLLEQDVDTVFGFPGGSVLYIYDALYKYQDKIRHILTCHEQGAAHAADGYARSTGKTGVVIATSGPGATNLVTGIATAYMDSVPMVAITGNVPLALLGKDSFQEIDITGVTMPITKHNFIVKRVEDVADTVRRAFFIAQSGRPGPVLIDIPKDITAALCEYEPKKPRQVERHTTYITDEALNIATKLICGSKRPMIFAGGGITAAGASDELKAFARKIAAPVTLSLMGIGNFPSDDEYYTGMIGMHGTKTSALAVSNCDLLIACGTRFSDRVLCNAAKFAPNAKILQLDVDPAEINKNILTFASVIGDIKITLTKLTEKLEDATRGEWPRQITELKKLYPIAIPLKDEVMPQHIFDAIHTLTNGEALITTEVGQHQMWTAQFYKFSKPRTFMTSGGLGTMGFGLGAAIGAQIAHPDKRVFNIAGDGSFYMNMAELVTAATYNLPLVEVIMNNGVLGMVRQWQKLFYEKRFSHTTLGRNTDFVKLAESVGVAGFVIATVDDIIPVFTKVLAQKGPCLIECRIGSDINVLPMVPAGLSISDQIFEMD
jgi:acetolactate synthase-1/2/3 large subunit